ncbi:methyltransferase [Streptomyces alboflavus]|uniref:methyltransferase n=1 Tax=Streptomyces alboflavus TaxID=67267 RepID=UPI0036B2D515
MNQMSLLELAFGHIPARILHAAVELRLADEFTDGPQDHRDLAKRTDADPATLHRLLRALAGLGVVTQVDADRFELTGTGRQLRADAPDSIRDHLLLHAVPEVWRSWGGLGHSVRTGAPARDPETGRTAAEFTLSDPELAATYHKALADGSRMLAPEITRAGDFGRFGTVADIGGGDGTLLAAILSAVPGPRGLLYDLPTAMETAPAILGEAGVADRCEIVGGDVFASVPSGADAYVLKNVIHVWDDEKSVVVLRNCRAVMEPGARLLLVETVLPQLSTPDTSAQAQGDLNMLVWSGGRERTEDDFRALLGAAGLSLTTTTEVVPGYHLVEAEPAT